MPLFHRSSAAEKKPRAHRFSFRRHSHEPNNAVKAPPPAAPAASSSSSTAPATTRQASASLPPPSSARQLPPKGSSITSEAATSVASSLRSSVSLSFLDRNSGGASGGAATAPETSCSSDSESEAADSMRPNATHKSPASRSLSSASSQSGGGVRSSLADYRQLRCSMSYKNRVQAESFRGDGGASRMSDLRAADLRSTDLRSTELSARISESGRSSRTSESRDRLSSSAPESVSESKSQEPHEVSPSSHSPQERASEARMTEANVAAMQTRRALQQMVLSLEDDDSEVEYESESEVVRSSRSSDAGVLHVNADDYRRFQFRLRQLEDLCQEQARKQSAIEETIEREVRNRTRKVVDAMEKNIAMYKQAKDAEIEREIQRRVSEMDGAARASLRSSYRESAGRYSSRESEKGKPLDKLFHPRRARRRLEMLKEREEQQKREMEQFREFIRATDSASSSSAHLQAEAMMGGKPPPSAAAAAALKELGDPLLTDALWSSSQQELVGMICVLRKHVAVQESQLNEAKSLISAAIEAREEAEETAREAVELTLQLDSRLDRASQEIVVIRDELRESQLHARSMASPLTDSALRSSSFLLTSDHARRKDSNSTMPSTPSSSCLE